MKYRKKPVVIEAMQFKDQNGLEIVAWAHSGKSPVTYHGNLNELHITTLEGVMVASKLDFIIQGVQGEFYPCKPDIFEATYELVEGQE